MWNYHYYHANERGDIEFITDDVCHVTNSYEYDAFGGIRNRSEEINNRYTYNGEAYDNVSGQYYLRARYYSPRVSRFMQEDMYRGDGLNLYAFCANNPVMYVDPSGYEYIPDLFSETGTVPGTSSSKNLGENIQTHIGVNSSKTGSHQAQHLMPQEVYNESSFLQSLGFNVDHHQNGIYDVNKNNSSTVLNDAMANAGVPDSLINRYVSENTHHNGYHSLYNEAVANQLSQIDINMNNYYNDLIKQGYDVDTASEMYRRESRKQVHSLLEDLRVMNQDGIDLYYDHASNSQKYNSSDEYEVEFQKRMEEAHEKNSKKCGR